MNISAIANVASELSQANTSDAIAIAVLKKALDMQAQSALQLIQALPQPVTSSPPNLGNGVNAFA